MWKPVANWPKNPSPAEGIFRSRALFPPRLSLRLARGVRSQTEQPWSLFLTLSWSHRLSSAQPNAQVSRIFSILFTVAFCSVRLCRHFSHCFSWLFLMTCLIFRNLTNYCQKLRSSCQRYWNLLKHLMKKASCCEIGESIWPIQWTLLLWQVPQVHIQQSTSSGPNKPSRRQQK